MIPRYYSETYKQDKLIMGNTVVIQISEDHFNRGSIKFDLQDFTGAIEEYTRAIEVDPKFVEAYNNRGLAKA